VKEIFKRIFWIQTANLKKLNSMSSLDEFFWRISFLSHNFVRNS